MTLWPKVPDKGSPDGGIHTVATDRVIYRIGKTYTLISRAIGRLLFLHPSFRVREPPPQWTSRFNVRKIP